VSSSTGIAASDGARGSYDTTPVNRSRKTIILTGIAASDGARGSYDTTPVNRSRKTIILLPPFGVQLVRGAQAGREPWKRAKRAVPCTQRPEVCTSCHPKRPATA